MCLQVKQLERDKIQLEKELKKLSEEVCKVLMGESQWSQTMLSNLISSKEKELSEISKKQGAIEDRLKDLSAYLAERKTLYADLDNWVERFNIQENAEKKTMLINVIDKITIYDDKATVKYKFKCDYLPGGSKYDKSNDLGFESVLEGGALCSTRVQSTYQPSRVR